MLMYCDYPTPAESCDIIKIAAKISIVWIADSLPKSQIDKNFRYVGEILTMVIIQIIKDSCQVK